MGRPRRAKGRREEHHDGRRRPQEGRGPRRLDRLTEAVLRTVAASSDRRKKPGAAPGFFLAVPGCARGSTESPASSNTSARQASGAGGEGRRINENHRRQGRAMQASERQAAVTKVRSEEHTSELQSLMRISYAVLCLQKKTQGKERKK